MIKNNTILISLVFSFLFLQNLELLAQSSKTQLGLQFGNNLSLPGERTSSLITERLLLRYSFGIAGRRVLKENLRWGFISKTRRGEITFDFGVNVNVGGYNYSFGGIDTHTNLVSFEVPLLISLFDRRNIFLSRKLLRKGITTILRLGLVSNFSPVKTTNKEIIKANEFLTENISTQFFNISWTLRGGIQKSFKNGNTSLFELGINLGILKNAGGNIQYVNSDTQVTQIEEFRDSGTYLSIRTTHFFRVKKRPFSKEVPPPIFYNPRGSP